MFSVSTIFDDLPPPRRLTKKQLASGLTTPAPVRAQTEKPATLDWNLWLGVAPYRDYLPYIAPKNWRGFWDYGSGALGDMGCHNLDAPFWSLDLAGDCTVTADYERDNTIHISPPKSSAITYKFPARGSHPPLTITWHDGGRLPAKPKELGDADLAPGGGALYYGDKGIMYSNGNYGNGIRLLPAGRMKTFRPPAKTIPRVKKSDPYIEWLASIQGLGPAPGSSIADYSADLTQFVLLGNLALRTNTPIHWQSATATCHNNPEAQPFINKNYRVY